MTDRHALSFIYLDIYTITMTVRIKPSNKNIMTFVASLVLLKQSNALPGVNFATNKCSASPTALKVIHFFSEARLLLNKLNTQNKYLFAYATYTVLEKLTIQ